MNLENKHLMTLRLLEIFIHRRYSSDHLKWLQLCDATLIGFQTNCHSQNHPEGSSLELGTSFAISPVVQQMHNRLPHTWPEGWQITLAMQRSLKNVECFISSFQGPVCVFNVYSVQLSTRLLTHQDQASASGLRLKPNSSVEVHYC